MVRERGSQTEEDWVDVTGRGGRSRHGQTPKNGDSPLPSTSREDLQVTVILKGSEEGVVEVKRSSLVGEEDEIDLVFPENSGSLEHPVCVDLVGGRGGRREEV